MIGSRGYFAMTVSALAVAMSHSAQAQDFYLGFAIEYGDTEMTDAIPLSYPGELVLGQLIAGVRVPTASQFFFGAEVETSLFSNYTTDSFIGDSIDRITRLRAIAGYDFGNFSAFAAAGRAEVDGNLAGLGLDSGASGTTFGLGAEIPLNDRIDLRIEAIRDNLEFENGNYSWDNTALRLGAIIKF